MAGRPFEILSNLDKLRDISTVLTVTWWRTRAKWGKSGCGHRWWWWHEPMARHRFDVPCMVEIKTRRWWASLHRKQARIVKDRVGKALVRHGHSKVDLYGHGGKGWLWWVEVRRAALGGAQERGKAGAMSNSAGNEWWGEFCRRGEECWRRC
jgi:hypothetical protein